MSTIENETLRKTTAKFTSEYSKFSFFLVRIRTLIKWQKITRAEFATYF